MVVSDTTSMYELFHKATCMQMHVVLISLLKKRPPSSSKDHSHDWLKKQNNSGAMNKQ